MVRPDFRGAFAVLLLVLVAACAHAGAASPLRFDGLYVTGEAEALAQSRTYIRFYPDGAVVMAQVDGPSTPQQVASWISPAHAWSSAGSYDLRLDHISFSVTGRRPGAGGDAVATAYQGIVQGDNVLLDRGRAGDVSIVTYRFAPANFPD